MRMPVSHIRRGEELNKWLCPLITVQGSKLIMAIRMKEYLCETAAQGYYGAVWDGKRIRVEPLTPIFDLSTHWKAIPRCVYGCHSQY